MEAGPRKELLAAHFSGGIPEQEGNLFSQGGMGEKGIFSFDDPIISIIRAYVMSKKPSRGTYRPHPLDAGEIDQAS